MLKGIDQRLSPELVYALLLMGHGDDIVICDVNHPATSIAKSTTYGHVINFAGADIPAAPAAFARPWRVHLHDTLLRRLDQCDALNIVADATEADQVRLGGGVLSRDNAAPAYRDARVLVAPVRETWPAELMTRGNVEIRYRHELGRAQARCNSAVAGV